MSLPTAILIEPDPVLRRLLQHHFSDRWLAYGAANACLAVPLFQSFRPDVVITEADLPFVNGIAVCDILKDRFPASAILVMARDVGALPLALRFGADAVLAKPVVPRRLEQIARELLHSRTGTGERSAAARSRPCPHCTGGSAVRVLRGTDRRAEYVACGTCVRVWSEGTSHGRRRTDREIPA